MNLQEALFLSSLGKAEYTCSVASRTDHHEYLVQVEIKNKEYTPLLGAGPCYRDTFEITVSRVVGSTIKEQKVYPPHITVTLDSLEECIEYLQRWRIGEGYEEPWHPIEQWDEEVKAEEPHIRPEQLV